MSSDSTYDKKRKGDIMTTTKPTEAPSQNKNKKRKRKRSKTLSKEKLHNLEVDEHYSKLLHQSTKILRKATKLSKAFECQKIVRKIKASMSSLNDDHHSNKCNIHTNENIDDANTDKKLKKRVKSLEEKLKYFKSIDLEEIVQVCVNRLGLNSLKPSKVEKNDKDGNDSESVDDNNYTNKDNKSSSEKHDPIVNHNDKEHRALIESIIQQKKVVSAMESINEFMLDYNRWLAKKEEWLYGNISSKSQKQKRKDRNSNNNSMNSKQNRDTNNNRSMVDTSGHETNSGLFITSLAGNDIEYDNEIDDEGKHADREGQDYDMYTDFAPNKKNRMGQRARKARAMALEAKKQGKYEAGNIKNWWEMKPKNPRRHHDNKNDITASGLDISKDVKAAEVVQMGSKWKEAGNAHPSWAARQVQKEKSGTGIGNIEFKGKKITFD